MWLVEKMGISSYLSLLDLFFKKKIAFIYEVQCWVFVAVRGLSLVAARGLWSAWASVVVIHGLRCPVVRGILPEPGSSPCLLHWQPDSQPLDHWERPKTSS